MKNFLRQHDLGHSGIFIRSQSCAEHLLSALEENFAEKKKVLFCGMAWPEAGKFARDTFGGKSQPPEGVEYVFADWMGA